MSIRCTHIPEYEIQLTIPVTVKLFVSGNRKPDGSWNLEQARTQEVISWLSPDQGLETHFVAPPESRLSVAWHLREFAQEQCRERWDEIVAALNEAELVEDEQGVRHEIH